MISTRLIWAKKLGKKIRKKLFETQYNIERKWHFDKITALLRACSTFTDETLATFKR
jgi:hypothetical protein